MSKRLSVLWLALLACAAPLANAQDKEPVGGYSAVIDNIDLLIDNYARFLARKYDLTDEQDGFTRELLRTRAYDFLDKHEDNLRGLVDRLFEVRTGAAMTPEELVDWGARVSPIYDEAKKLIVIGNDEFRGVLTEPQQKIHDSDLNQMNETFHTVDDQLSRIAKGEMTIEEFRNPMRKARPSRRPPAPPPAARAISEAHSAEAGIVHHEDVSALESGVRSEEIPAPAAAAIGENGEVIEPHQTGEIVTAPGAPPALGQPQAQSVGEGEEGAAHEAPPVPHDAASPDGERRGAAHAPDGVGEAGENAHAAEAARNARNAKTTAQKTPGHDYEGEWDKYVQDFIVRYSLDESQRQKADAILADCKEQANRYMSGKKSDFERLDAREKELQASKEKSKSADLSELTKTRQKLREPIGQVFERQLKPRLEKIPTRAQRKEAETAAKAKKAPTTTRPASSRPTKTNEKP